jgi:molybdopterin synthase catalytic subunit
MFKITDKVIDESVSVSPRAGARVIFDGIVRNHNDGLDVSSLEYQAYEEMAVKEGLKIVEEAKLKFEVISAYCVHRVGHLQIGDIAVWVEVYSEHRKEAFLACQYIIDEVKLRVPIWKREHYVDKDPEWIACHRCASAHSHTHA